MMKMKNGLWMLLPIFMGWLVITSIVSCTDDNTSDDPVNKEDVPWEEYDISKIQVLDSGTISLREVCQNTIAHEMGMNDDIDSVLVGFAAGMIDSITAYEKHINDSLEAVSGGNDFIEFVLSLSWRVISYESVSVTGYPITLSALFVYPDLQAGVSTKPKNYYIGTHVTITDNDECPSSFSKDRFTSDVGMLAVFANVLLNHGYVILPDYEGYGITVDRCHPYLCEELTARQVVDAVRYGIALYKTSSVISSIRHPFRPNWRSMCIGYSQGGGVALATHRFIEQNGLTDELHFSGSVCGAGPYDPIATLYYYAQQYSNGDPLKMPVLMPLIMRGMCCANPYMKNHQPSDYLSQAFLATGILDMIDSKTMTTDDIYDALVSYYSSTQYVSSGNLNLPLSYILTPPTFSYIYSLYGNYPDYTNIPLPTHRGVREDLHFALESNNLTHGWMPQHAMFLYHSYEDTVVPESNRQSASYAFGSWVIKLHASFGDLQFDHVGTGVQYFMGTNETNAVEALAGAPIHQTIQDAINLRSYFSSSELD